VVAKFIRQALSGKTCVIYGDGNQTRDFLYIEDLVRAVLLSMEMDVGGETFQIATGLESTIGDVAQAISQELSRRGMSMTISHDQPRLGDVKRNFADTTKAKNMLGWECRMPLENGIEKTVDYFISTMPISSIEEK
jgi:UDP-glucose 4-epimerase